MKLKILAKDARLTPDQTDIIEKKLRHRIAKFLPGDDEEVMVKVTEKNKLYKVEITMKYAGFDLRTEAQERDNALTALDRGLDAMEGQVRKSKTRHARRLRPSHVATVPVDVTEEPADETSETRYDIVKVKKYEMKPMTSGEAVVLMDLLGHNFYMFRNSESGKHATIYRRNDGDYGMIEPE